MRTSGEGLIAPDVRAREAAKTIDLLGFALDRAGVSRGWSAAPTRAEMGTPDDCLCLFGEDGWWIVAYVERGSWREDARFPGCQAAAQFLFWQMTGAPGIYQYREAWEAASGTRFSLMA